MLILALLLACAAPGPPVVVLVSLDTTRADALSAWASELPWRPELLPDQRPAPATPVLDGLAARGTRFAWALAQSPTTLASHASVMTGHDPHGHGVVRNGAPLGPKLPVLAETLAAAGWDTLAMPGAAVLAADQGLGRGFRLYGDPRPHSSLGGYALEAQEVTRQALALVDQRRPEAPLLLFVHYYDAHMPWQSATAAERARFTDPAYAGPVHGAPTDIGLLTRASLSRQLDPADARQARGLYLAQVAHVDAALGTLLDGLGQRGLLEDSLVVAFGDHGESLDEAAHTRPWSHGPDVDLVNLHVPLLVSGQGRFGPQGEDAVPAGLVVSRQVRLMDLAPTLLGLLHLPAIGTGEDLGPLLRGASPAAPPAFAEANLPVERERPGAWNNLPMERAVAQDGHLLIVDPDQGTEALYGLAPGQPPRSDPARARALRELLAAWDAAAPPFRDATPDPATRRALTALGYLLPPLPPDEALPEDLGGELSEGTAPPPATP